MGVGGSARYEMCSFFHGESMFGLRFGLFQLYNLLFLLTKYMVALVSVCYTLLPRAIIFVVLRRSSHYGRSA